MMLSRLAPGTSSTHHTLPFDSRYLPTRPATSGQPLPGSMRAGVVNCCSQVERDVDGDRDALSLDEAVVGAALSGALGVHGLNGLDELAGAVSGRDADGHGAQKFV